MAKRKFQREYSVLIAKPHNIECQTDERVTGFCMKSLERGVAEYLSIPSKLPELARNYAIHEFLHNPKHAKKTHLFFLDADTKPVNEYTIELLLSHNKDVVAGVTPIFRIKDREINCMWSAVIKDNDKLENLGIDELPKKLFKADRVGGTTLLLSRKVLKALKTPYQESKYNETVTNIKLSEDFDFCEKIKEAGFDIWVDPTCVCSHYHLIDILDIFQIYKQSKGVLV